MSHYQILLTTKPATQTKNLTKTHSFHKKCRIWTNNNYMTVKM